MMIETSRLILRPHRVDDFDRYAALFAESEPAAPYALPALNREDAWARLLRFIGHWAHFGYGLLVAEERASGFIVAEVGLANFQRVVDPECEDMPEAAWRVSQRVRRRGIGIEAMHAALSWFDRDVRSERTCCLIHPDNTPSLRVAARLDFREVSRGRYKGEPVIFLQRRREASEVGG
jgi:RimJ/RimL family protein N-acetyltransferase